VKSICDEVRDALSEHGARAASAAPAQAHLLACPGCREFLAALDEIEAAFGAMPERDAPPRIVEQVIASARIGCAATAVEVAVAPRPRTTRSDRHHPSPAPSALTRHAEDHQMKQHEIQHLSYSGAVDADGHILEAPDLWERYLEPRYRENALRLRTDAHGLEYLEINGAPSKVVRGGMLGMLGGMGRDLAEVLPAPDHTYAGGASFGAMDARERVARLDQEGLDAAFLYPTLGVLWEAECSDADVAQAYTRAYNRWIVEFCADSDKRLLPVAHLSLGDPEAAARELERAVRDGCHGGWVAPFTMTQKPHGHPDHDRLWATAQELGVPLAIHPTFEPKWAPPGRFAHLRGTHFFENVTAADGVRHAFTTLFQFGVFDRFPRLKLVLLESGAGWIGYWLDRMDGYASSLLGRAVPLQKKPSTYFRRQCWISCDPDEQTIPALMDLYGADRFLWASDFPHPDHTGDYIAELDELAGKLKPAERARLLGGNVRECFGV
jgi:predicted TIM-barrel fold metal-dependent hydrolase